MQATVALLFLAALPVGQVPDTNGSNPRLASRQTRPVLAADNDPSAAQANPSAARFAPPEDACLHDVAFVASQHGWAVGDQGVILHTDDGGRRWSPQSSGVSCTLHSVSFFDARIGWAAGGMAWPYLHDTSGVVLATRDGGRTWQRLPALLPALHKIRFVTDRQGWAIGCSSAMYPSGVFLTRDGGLSWLPAATNGAIGMTAGDLYDGRNAILGGSRGRLATISAGEFARKSFDAASLPGIHAIQTVPPSYGWLVGDGGWVALTGDRGNSWRPPLGKLPAYAALFDFTALAVRGGKCWIAGSPGSRIFSTPDAGRSWSAAPTGVNIPIRAITFADDDHGWAVGQLGTILATSDGGRSWQQQRAAGARAALMAVAGRSEDLPLELFARECKDRGYFGVGEVIGREDVDSARTGDAPLADRLHQAMATVGACGGEMAWGFPVPSAALQFPAQKIVENWNRYQSGRATDALTAHLVRQIRTWRPDVLLICTGRSCDGLNEVLRKTVESAAKLAGDPTYLPNMFPTAGCAPWHVRVQFIAREISDTGDPTLTPDEWSPGLGQSWAAAALPARGLLGGCGYQAPAPIGVEETVAAPNVPPGQPQNPYSSRYVQDIMSGTTSYADGMFRRRLGGGTAHDRSKLEDVAHRRQIEDALAQLKTDPEATVARLAKGNELLRNLDAATSAALTFRIAEQLCHCGHWDLADRAFALFLERYPDDPLARYAIVWRLQYMANVSGTLRVLRPASGYPDGTRSVPDTLLFARQIEMGCPDLFASPAVRYPLAAVYRRQGRDADAQRLYVLDHRGADRDTWWSCGHGERWLADRKGPPPRPLTACPAVTERPHLDGRLDEPIWKKCTPIALTSPLGDDRAWPATVSIAHDEKFLYLAVQCRQAPGVRYESTTQPRPRDPDLSQHDRVDIYLDIDRSYAGYYHLSIDHRGWAADECCGDLSWNPKWFVAAKTADGTWTAEAAIPLTELGEKIVPSKTVWALGIQRTVPGVGFQSWTAPAAPQVMPEGFGWLEFE